MRTVDVGICHNNNLAITCLLQIEVIADTTAEGGNHIADFFTAQHLIKTCLFNIKDFTAAFKVAWKSLLRPCLALPPAESPSTR